MMATVSGPSSQWQRCPYCGGLLTEPLGGRGGGTCPECFRVPNAPARPYYGVYGAVEYDFDDVSAVERAEAADLLIEAAVPYRWEDGYRLFVDPNREDDVDALFGQTGDEEAADATTPELALTDDDDDDPTEWVADEEAVSAMSRLFDASDRLRHHPNDDNAAAELADATGVVLVAPPPFGVNKVLWVTAGMLARQLLDLVEGDVDGEDVAAGAEALRAVLRDHV
jgi:hypothetical protein